MSDYNLGTARGRIEIDGSGATDGAREAERAVDGLTGKWGKAAGALTKVGASFMAVGGAVAGGFALAVKTASDFEAQISGIAAVSGATSGEIDQIRKKALQLGKDTVFSASESAQAMEELVKAGLSVGDVLNGAADATVALAAAGGVDMPTAATIAANAMNQFGLAAKEMPKVADLIAGAANASAIDVTDFGQSMGQAGAVAHLAGMSFEDTALAITAMGNAGIKGSDAGTSLKSMLQRLQPQTEKQMGLMEDLGIITKDGANQFFDASGKIKSMSQIAGVLQKSLKGMSDQQKSATLATLFGTDAIRAAAVIADTGSKGFTDLAGSMKKVTAEQVAQARMNNLAGEWEQLKGSLETVAITIGERLLPAIRSLVKFLTGLVNWFLELSPGVQKAILLFVAITAAVITFIGVVATVAGIILGIVAALAPLAAAIGIGVGALLSIVAVIPIVIAAVVALAIIIVKNWDTIKKWTVQAWDAIKNAVGAAWDWISAKVSSALAWIGGIFSSAGAALSAAWSAVWSSLVAVVNVIWTVITTIIMTYFNIWKTIITTALNVILAVWNAVWGMFGPLIKAVWDLIVAIVMLGVAIVQLVVARFLQGLKNIWETVWGAISAVAQAVWGVISAVITREVNGIKKIVTTVFNAVKAVVTTIWNAIKSATSAVWNAVYSAVSGPINKAKSIVSSVVNSIKNAVTSAFNGAKSAASTAFNGLYGAVKDKMDDAYQKVKGVVSNIRGFFSNAGSWLLSAGRNIIQGLINGITEKIRKVTDLLHDLTNKIKNAKGPEKVDRVLLEENGEQIIGSLIAGFQKEIPNALKLLSNLTVAIPDAVPTATAVLSSAGLSNSTPLPPPVSPFPGGPAPLIGHQTVYYPKAEPASQAAARQATRAALLGGPR